MQSWQNEELKETVETLVNLDEPEALLATLSRTVQRRRDPRWQALASVLIDAEMKLDAILNAKPAGPDFRPPEASAAEPESESAQPPA